MSFNSAPATRRSPAAARVTITVVAANKPPRLTREPRRPSACPPRRLLAGAATDDGLPATRLTSAWLEPGQRPGAATFGANAATPRQASFSTAGAYVLQLTASDTALVLPGTVTITVGAANLVPVVNAGANQSITLPAGANLAGAVTDDGCPPERPSPPAGAKSADRAPWPSPTQRPRKQRELFDRRHLRAATERQRHRPVLLGHRDDHGHRPEPPPAVSAGAAQTIRLPAAAALSGTATDDGQPANSQLSVAWSQVSGPGTAVFASPKAAVTQVSFPGRRLRAPTDRQRYPPFRHHRRCGHR